MLSDVQEKLLNFICSHESSSEFGNNQGPEVLTESSEDIEHKSGQIAVHQNLTTTKDISQEAPDDRRDYHSTVSGGIQCSFIAER